MGKAIAKESIKCIAIEWPSRPEVSVHDSDDGCGVRTPHPSSGSIAGATFFWPDEETVNLSTISVGSFFKTPQTPEIRA